jgi:hypothetical protein
MWMSHFLSGFFLSCKANAKVKLAKTGHGPHASKLVVIVLFCCYLCCSVVIVLYCCCLCCSVVICVVLSLFVLFCCYCFVLLLFVLFCYYLCCPMYCLCVNVYCTTATGCFPNCSWQIYQYQLILLTCSLWEWEGVSCTWLRAEASRDIC